MQRGGQLAAGLQHRPPPAALQVGDAEEGPSLWVWPCARETTQTPQPPPSPP